MYILLARVNYRRERLIPNDPNHPNGVIQQSKIQGRCIYSRKGHCCHHTSLFTTYRSRQLSDPESYWLFFHSVLETRDISIEGCHRWNYPKFRHKCRWEDKSSICFWPFEICVNAPEQDLIVPSIVLRFVAPFLVYQR